MSQVSTQIPERGIGYASSFYGNTAQFGKKSQPEFLPQFKVPKMEEYCMYFPFLELRKWGKKAAETRRRNCAVLPYYCKTAISRNLRMPNRHTEVFTASS